MNIQERQQLANFLQQLGQAQAGFKDGEAEGLIRDAFAHQPDAAYLLVQRALLLEQALQAAKDEVGRLQGELQSLRAPSQNSGSFLGGWNSPPPPAPMPQPATAAPAAAGSGFLRNMATTAAGVVAGAFLFQGIENLMGHHGGGWGSANNLAGNGMLPSELNETTVVNNYYGDPSSTADDFLNAGPADDSFDDSGSNDWI